MKEKDAGILAATVVLTVGAVALYLGRGLTPLLIAAAGLAAVLVVGKALKKNSKKN